MTIPTDTTELETVTAMRELAQALNAHDLGRIQALHADDFAGYNTGRPTPIVGSLELRAIFTRAFVGLPDFHVQIEEFVADGPRVCARWRVEATHKGPLLHIPATNRRVSFEGYSTLDVHAGQIKTSHTLWDMAGLLRQVGLLPALPNDPR
jgi:steroid delta-isomerase-like uncharacterized protein